MMKDRFSFFVSGYIFKSCGLHEGYDLPDAFCHIGGFVGIGTKGDQFAAALSVPME